MNAPPILARVFRGDQVESFHRGHIVAVDGDGRVVYAAGNGDVRVYLRSAAKPFQALPAVHAGVQEAFGLSEAELALMCASHNGEEMHVQAAASILQKCGLTPAALQCGVHRPIGVDLGVVPEKSPYDVLQNNCSGKHAGMLAACRRRGWPIESYLDPGHPHQQRILQTISEYSGVAAAEIGVDVDGCSAPVFHLPLRALAHMYARFARREDAAADLLFRCMSTNPQMVAGSGRFDTAVMQAFGGRLVAKIGAEGLQCFAVCQPHPLGVAIKIEDGNGRATPPVALRLLLHLGLADEVVLSKLRDFAAPAIRNHRGWLVGHIDCPLDFAEAAIAG